MELFLIRHAVAVPRAAGIDDAARPLTPRGRERWDRAVAGLARLGVGFDRLYHSPWLRAVETANALVPLVDGETVVTLLLARSPDEKLLEALDGERVALVGHEPWLSELLATLVVGTHEAAAKFELKKGSVAWLDGRPRPSGMRLRALLTPKVLRSLARKS